MNKLLLLPGLYHYWTHASRQETGPQTYKSVRVYIVHEDRGQSLFVLREDAPELDLWKYGGRERCVARKGVYFEVPNSDCEVDLTEIAADPQF